MTVLWCGDFLPQATNRDKISVGFTSNSLLTVQSLFDTGARPNIISEYSSPPTWRESAKFIELPELRTANQKVINNEGVVPLSVSTGLLGALAGIEISKSVAVDTLLGTSFIDPCIRGLFKSERKIVPVLSGPVAIISWTRLISYIFAYSTVLELSTTHKTDKELEELYLCHISPQISIPACMQAVILVSGQRPCTLLMEIHRNVVERQCSMTARDVMGIMTSRAFYVFIANMMARPVNLPKFMIVSPASNTPACIVHAHEDEPIMLQDPQHPTTPWSWKEAEEEIYTVNYKPA